jgi:hypothetical protein
MKWFPPIAIAAPFAGGVFEGISTGVEVDLAGIHARRLADQKPDIAGRAPNERRNADRHKDKSE